MQKPPIKGIDRFGAVAEKAFKGLKVNGWVEQRQAGTLTLTTFAARVGGLGGGIIFMAASNIISWRRMRGILMQKQQDRSLWAVWQPRNSNTS